MKCTDSKERKALMNQSVEDPLKKRETFAVNLRTQKRKDKISEKRRKLTDSAKKQDQMEEGSEEDNSNHLKPYQINTSLSEIERR
jgi:hypothetical protein